MYHQSVNGILDQIEPLFASESALLLQQNLLSGNSTHLKAIFSTRLLGGPGDHGSGQVYDYLRFGPLLLKIKFKHSLSSSHRHSH
jgi:hypothetical protein